MGLKLVHVFRIIIAKFEEWEMISCVLLSFKMKRRRPTWVMYTMVAIKRIHKIEVKSYVQLYFWETRLEIATSCYVLLRECIPVLLVLRLWVFFLWTNDKSSGWKKNADLQTGSSYFFHTVQTCNKTKSFLQLHTVRVYNNAWAGRNV